MAGEGWGGQEEKKGKKDAQKKVGQMFNLSVFISDHIVLSEGWRTEGIGVSKLPLMSEH